MKRQSGIVRIPGALGLPSTAVRFGGVFERSVRSPSIRRRAGWVEGTVRPEARQALAVGVAGLTLGAHLEIECSAVAV